MVEIERGGTVPVPCRSCGKFLKFRVEEGTSHRRCESCNRSTIITCRRRDNRWVILTAPDGALSRKPC